MSLASFLLLFITFSTIGASLPPNPGYAKRSKNFLGTDAYYRKYLNNLIMLITNNSGDINVLYSEFCKQYGEPKNEGDINRWFSYVEDILIQLVIASERQSIDTIEIVSFLRIYTYDKKKKKELSKMKNWIEAESYARKNGLESSIIKVPKKNCKYFENNNGENCFYFRMKSGITKENKLSDTVRLKMSTIV